MPELTYHTILTDLLIEHLLHHLHGASPGHCLRLEGLPADVLRTACIALQDKAPETKTVLLSNHLKADYEVSATKLIELRNLAEDSHSLLVLIPSNLRTAAEDSFDRTTFKQIEAGPLQHRVIERLKSNIPTDVKGYYERILHLLWEHGRMPSAYDHAEYLLHCLRDTRETSVWGRNLFLFGLIPDDLLLDDPKLLEQRLYQNIVAVQCVQNESEPLSRRIFQLAVQPGTIQKPLFDFLTTCEMPEDCRTWGWFIAEQTELAHLNLKEWPFTDLKSLKELELFVHPFKGKDVVLQEGEKRVIAKTNRASKVSVKFETRPKPVQVNDLTHFRIDLMRTNEDGEIETVTTLIKFKKTAGKTATRAKQVQLNPDHLDEGVYFFRVYALDKAGTMLNRYDRFREQDLQEIWKQRFAEMGDQASRSDLQGKLTCDSEDFYFVIDNASSIRDDEYTSGTRRTKAASLLQALIKARLDYVKHAGQPDSLEITKCVWTDNGKSAKRHCELEVHCNDVRHHYVIPYATMLRTISWEILRNPGRLGMFRLDFTAQSQDEQRSLSMSETHVLDAAPDYFLEARKAAFTQILEQIRDEKTGSVSGIVESCDLQAIAESLETYLAAYQQWLGELIEQAGATPNEQVIRAIKQIQLLDHVELVLPKTGGQREYVLLLPPLHPLRLGWFLQLYRLYLRWEELSLESSESAKLWHDEAQEVFLGGLKPSNQPVVVQGRRLKSGSSSFYYAGDVSPGWGLYVPVAGLHVAPETATSRALIGQVQDVLGIPGYLCEEADFSVKSLYRQIRRYILQHPYVEVLHINVFNPGSGNKIVECLKLLQREQTFSQLRYEIRLIASSERLNETGSAFDDFLRPSGAISDEADAFIVPTANPLFPKIRFSRNSLAEYQVQPEKYEAHLSILLDMFPVDVKLLRETTLEEERSVFCHGLVIDPINQVYHPGEDTMGWHHYLAINDTPSISDDDVLTDALSASLRQLQHIVAIALAGKWTEDIPALSMLLRDVNRTLIYQIHQQSGWVVTIDRNLGIDLFDVPTDPDCLPYLLDYSPGSTLSEPPILLTTRPSSEVYSVMKPHLLQYGVSEVSKLAAFLETLRSVSGSVIMQFLSSPTKAFETIGLALSRLLLNHLDLLNDHFMIPLDMHQDLFHISSDDQTFSRQRGDFLLVSCDSATDTLDLQIIEVKCRTHLGEGVALTNLKAKITEQLEQTIHSLQYHFDPNLSIPDRLDRAMKLRQLYQLLDFYLKRAWRYGLLAQETFEEYQHALTHLHPDYTLSFRQIGLIFEFESEQHEILQDEAGASLVFFHIGRPMIDQLFAQLGEAPVTQEEREELLTDDLERMRTTLRKSHRPDSHRRTSVQPVTLDEAAPVPVVSETIQEEVEPSVMSDQPTPPQTPEAEEDYRTPPPTGTQVTEVSETPYKAPSFTDLIGDDHEAIQYGLLASTKEGRKLALDLNGCNTISLFGVPGGGKSYTLGSIVEMAIQPIPAINHLPNPLATVIFHYHESQDYPPEFVSMRYPNDQERELDLLRKMYGAEPQKLDDVVLLVPKDKIALRQQEYPDVTITPLAFSSQELSIKDWKFLMGALGNQAMYMQHINMIMQKGRDNLTLEFIREQVKTSFLSEAQKMYAHMRLELAAQFIDDSARLRDLLIPGKLIIVDLRDEFIEKDQALGLFVVMLNIFAGARRPDGTPFNKLIVFDEAHKYITHSDLTSHVVEVIRQMRHQGVTLLIASQDPPSLPNEVIELSSIILLHRFNSPKWLSHIQKSSIALKNLTPAQLSQLQPGEAYLWANKATNAEWTRKAIKVITRPRVTQHGGSTQKAVG